ncbi:MAG: type II toxin-antitoxin system VapB family antitoxin [Acidobacteriota bacterium]|nr:type II toxin-antitoxin system VapB family antitoxin [Acidobacteriota bacterium]
MRTTLDIEDAVLAQARTRASREGTTLTAIVEQALRLFLSKRSGRPSPLASRWVVVDGRERPDVDIADRDRLYDAMGGR